MPLSMRDCKQKTIVDWGYEWIGRVEGQTDGVQKPKDYIHRGMIVKVDGDVSGQSVTGLWCAFGASDKLEESVKGREHKNMKVNGKEVTCYKFEGSELVRVYDSTSKYAVRAWERLFGFPTLVGTVRKQSTPHRAQKTVEDNLALTAVPRQSVVEDARDEDVPGVDLPVAEA